MISYFATCHMLIITLVLSLTDPLNQLEKSEENGGGDDVGVVLTHSKSYVL